MPGHESALVVGASRGLGLAIARELLERSWDVTGTVRESKHSGFHIIVEQHRDRARIEYLDITDKDQISALKSRLENQTFDLVFISAGTANSRGMRETIGESSTEEFVRLMVTNAISPMRVVEQLADRVRPGGVLGIMSSGQGSIGDNESGGNDIYRASKAALNMLMRSFAVRSRDDCALLLLAPGWVKTDMGGSEAKFTIDQVISDIVDTIISQRGKTGLQFLDRFGKTVRW